MKSDLERIVEKLEAASRVRSDIEILAKTFQSIMPADYEKIMGRFIEQGSDKCLGILLNVIAVNKNRQISYQTTFQRKCRIYLKNFQKVQK